MAIIYSTVCDITELFLEFYKNNYVYILTDGKKDINIHIVVEKVFIHHVFQVINDERNGRKVKKH